MTEVFGRDYADAYDAIYRGKDYEIPTGSPAGYAQKLKDTLTAIQTGRAPDPHNWLLYI